MRRTILWGCVPSNIGTVSVPKIECPKLDTDPTLNVYEKWKKTLIEIESPDGCDNCFNNEYLGSPDGMNFIFCNYKKGG